MTQPEIFGYIAKPTQESRILKILQEAKGEWVNGRYFLQTMMFSQYHSRIKGLEKHGYKIIHSDFIDEYGFKSYKLVEGQFKKDCNWKEYRLVDKHP